MTANRAAPAARHTRPTGAMVASGLAMMVPLGVTVVMMLTEVPFPHTAAGTYGLAAAQHLVAVLGAVTVVRSPRP